jgi:hypothetical protein
MTDVAYNMAVTEAATDKMTYSFARYLTHCVIVSSWGWYCLHGLLDFLCVLPMDAQ